MSNYDNSVSFWHYNSISESLCSFSKLSISCSSVVFNNLVNPGNSGTFSLRKKESKKHLKGKKSIKIKVSSDVTKLL